MPENGALSAIDYIRKLDSVNDGGTVAVEYFGNRITRTQYWEMIDRYRACLASLGIERGDAVTICMLNSPEYEFIFAALLENGSIASTVSKSFINADIKRQTIERGAKTLIMSVEFVEELKKHGTFSHLGDNSGKVRLEQVIFTSAARFMPPEQQEKYDKPDAPALIDSLDLPKNIRIIYPDELKKLVETVFAAERSSIDLMDDVATYSNTGGTTGAPKCAVHTHRAIASLLASHQRSIYPEFDLMEHSRSLLVIPISHITSQFYALLTRRAYGATIVYNPFSFDPTVLRTVLIKERIDDVTLPFGLYYAITRNLFQKGELNLHTPCCGGEPTPYLPTKEVDELLRRAGCNSLNIGTGSTEFGSAIMGTYGLKGRVNESGYFFPYAQGFLIDPKNGEKIDRPGKRGILYANAPWQMKGYLNDEKATDDFFNICENGVLYGTNNDIAEIVSEHNGKPVYSMVGRASDYVLTRDGKTYYPGVSIVNGSVRGVDFEQGGFLFDMRDTMLNLNGVAEVQPIILSKSAANSEGYPVAFVTLRKDCFPGSVLKEIYDHFAKAKDAIVPAGIVFLTRFDRSLSSDKREVLSLHDVRDGYYRMDKKRGICKVAFPLGDAPKETPIADVSEVRCVEPPQPRAVFSTSIKKQRGS